MSTESRLRSIRTDLKISRERLAYLAGGNLCIGTIRNAELNRCRITVNKAQQILAAINALLVEAQKPMLSMDDLEMRLY